MTRLALAVLLACYAALAAPAVTVQRTAPAKLDWRKQLKPVTGVALKRLISGSVVERGDRNSTLWSKETFYPDGRYVQENTGDMAPGVGRSIGTYRILRDRYCSTLKTRQCYFVAKAPWGGYFERNVAVVGERYNVFPIRSDD